MIVYFTVVVSFVADIIRYIMDSLVCYGPACRPLHEAVQLLLACLIDGAAILLQWIFCAVYEIGFCTTVTTCVLLVACGVAAVICLIFQASADVWDRIKLAQSGHCMPGMSIIMEDDPGIFWVVQSVEGVFVKLEDRDKPGSTMVVPIKELANTTIRSMVPTCLGTRDS